MSQTQSGSPGNHGRDPTALLSSVWDKGCAGTKLWHIGTPLAREQLPWGTAGLCQLGAPQGKLAEGKPSLQPETREGNAACGLGQHKGAASSLSHWIHQHHPRTTAQQRHPAQRLPALRKNCQSFRNLSRRGGPSDTAARTQKHAKVFLGSKKGTELNPAQGQLGHVAERGLSFVGFLPLLEPSRQESSSKQKLPHAWKSLGEGEAEICASLFFQTQWECDSTRVSGSSVPKGSHRVKKAPCF